MQLEHTFTVPVAIDHAWEALVDFERVAPCLPGATLADIDGDVLTGAVKVKLGPVSLNYEGAATVLERDQASRTMVMDGRAKDSRGNGTAAAMITTRLEELDPATTAVHVVTDLNVTGRPAQFGRGLMQDVSTKIVGQFADRLATELTSPRPVAAAPGASNGAGPDAGSGPRVTPVENAPLDLGSVLPMPTPTQVAVGVGALALVAIAWRSLRR